MTEQSKRVVKLLLITTVCTILSGCANLSSILSHRNTAVAPLDDALLSRFASAPLLKHSGGKILTDNDDAFLTKLNLIRNAQDSIDLAYYIFDDDYSSSLMARELIAATARGVRVRMLLDFHSHYKHTDYFLMLQRYGNNSTGSLDVRFYNRPSQKIIKDVVYLTLGCGEDGNASEEDCSQEKFLQIEALFADELIDGESAAASNISNINTGNSGRFLSGLYAKNPQLMAKAVANGQGIDVNSLKDNAGASQTDDAEQLKQLARLYWLANYGSGLDRLINRFKLSTAFLLYSEQLDPVYDTFTAWLPVERPNDTDEQKRAIEQARNDWQYLTDFLHHKILLVDQQQLVVGGRNVQDAYHMNPNPLSAKYTFMDTDVMVQLDDIGTALTQSFEKLWDFKTMVARLEEVMMHAPIDFLVNSSAAAEHCAPLADENAEVHQSCLSIELAKHSQTEPAERHKRLYQRMTERAQTYQTDYAPEDTAARSPMFNIEQEARIVYVENLPFDKSLPQQDKARLYGATNNQEFQSGKNIHALWLAAMKKSCDSATQARPVSIYLHNAYFFLPSNMLSALAQMTDGRWRCANVNITVLTNSIETTDLNVVNLLSRHSMKALFEHYAVHHNPETGATLDYVEYIKPDEASNRSLHSKVMVFGDDIYIGSANADLRSYLMDTNNGVFLEQASTLVRDYTDWLESIMTDGSRAANRNAEYLTTDRVQMVKADEKLVDAELAKYRAERFIDDPEQIRSIKTRLREATNEVYRLSKEIVTDHTGTSREQERFNQLFKKI